ncbi:MAG: hypothetical protein HC834_09840, partial [Rhodospirillales bacterium]|nr:hypothetical protein [Rhodospirillales bacterium]
MADFRGDELFPEASIAAAQSKKASILSTLVSTYESQRAIDSILGGSLLLPRTGLPIVDDTPVISASTTAPSSDTDAASQVIYPFIAAPYAQGVAIPKSALQNKQYLRGFSEAVKGSFYYGSYGLANGVAFYSTEIGSGGNDPVLGYSLTSSAARSTLDIYLDGDVLFYRGRTPGPAGLCYILVNGS